MLSGQPFFSWNPGMVWLGEDLTSHSTLLATGRDPPSSPACFLGWDVLQLHRHFLPSFLFIHQWEIKAPISCSFGVLKPPSSSHPIICLIHLLLAAARVPFTSSTHWGRGEGWIWMNGWAQGIFGIGGFNHRVHSVSSSLAVQSFGNCPFASPGAVWSPWSSCRAVPTHWSTQEQVSLEKEGSAYLFIKKFIYSLLPFLQGLNSSVLKPFKNAFLHPFEKTNSLPSLPPHFLGLVLNINNF